MQRLVSPLLRPLRVILSSVNAQSCRRASARTLTPDIVHARVINPDGIAFLESIKITKKAKHGELTVSLLEHIQSYRGDTYAEKSVLLDSDVAEGIAAAIQEHSTRDSSTTTFIDADAGFCYVTKFLLERNVFCKAKVFWRDPRLIALNQHAAKTVLGGFGDRVDFEALNLVSTVAEFLENSGQYVSPLYNALEPSTWTEEVPLYTIFGTVTHGLIKYLTMRCLERHSIESEFYKGRPEFFFLVTARTWRLLNVSGSENALSRPKNILFQLVFDFKLAGHFPRKSFLPWRQTSQSAAAKNAESDDALVLVRMRPKSDIGLAPSIKPVYIEYFVHSIYRNSTIRLVPLLERLVPGVGIELIKAGYSIYDLTGNVSIGQLKELLNLLQVQPNFEQSTFVVQSEEYAKSKFKDSLPETKEGKLLLQKMRRRYKLNDT